MSDLLHNGTMIGGKEEYILYSKENNSASWGRDKVAEFNAHNVLPSISDAQINSSGVTGNVTDEIFTLKSSSTLSSSFSFDIVDSRNSVPDWFEAGKYIYIGLDKSGIDSEWVSLRIIYMKSNGTSSVLSSFYNSELIKVPSISDIRGLILRIFIPSSRTVDCTARFYVLNGLTNDQLTKEIEDEKYEPNPPMLTIIDDDGNPKFYSDLLPLVVNKGVSITSAVISEWANQDSASEMSWSQIEEASISGAEIVNHTFNHLTNDVINNPTSPMSTNDVWLNYQKARNTIASHGIEGGKYLVYAGASGSDAKAQEAAKRSCMCAFRAGGNEINYKGKLNRYYISRYRVQTDGYDYNPDQLKALIDKCLAEGGWMVWMIHTSETVWTTLNGLSAITAAIDYATQRGLPLVSIDTACKYYIN